MARGSLAHHKSEFACVTAEIFQQNVYVCVYLLAPPADQNETTPGDHSNTIRVATTAAE